MDLAQNFSDLFTIQSLVNLLILSVLEIVLGIDNIIFISIVAGKLPLELQRKGRSIGLLLALGMRIIMLFSITWIISFNVPLFTIGSYGCTGRDLILMGGGIFLIYKTIKEIREKIFGHTEVNEDKSLGLLTLRSAVIQIVIIDIVFSFDSILTAIGVVRNVLVMIGAVIISMIIMLIFSEKVSNFINRNPTIKMLALAFLVMIGVLLVADALHYEVDKSYVYIAMGFSFAVELLNMRMKREHEKQLTKH